MRIVALDIRHQKLEAGDFKSEIGCLKSEVYLTKYLNSLIFKVF